MKKTKVKKRNTSKKINIDVKKEELFLKLEEPVLNLEESNKKLYEKGLSFHINKINYD